MIPIDLLKHWASVFEGKSEIPELDSNILNEVRPFRNIKLEASKF